jgi:hypothetical protein
VREIIRGKLSVQDSKLKQRNANYNVQQSEGKGRSRWKGGIAPTSSSITSLSSSNFSAIGLGQHSRRRTIRKNSRCSSPTTTKRIPFKAAQRGCSDVVLLLQQDATNSEKLALNYAILQAQRLVYRDRGPSGRGAGMRDISEVHNDCGHDHPSLQINTLERSAKSGLQFASTWRLT